VSPRHRPRRRTWFRRAGEIEFRRVADAIQQRTGYRRAMPHRVERLLADRRVRLVADAGLAAVLAVAALVDVADDRVAWGGRGAGQVALALLVTLPLAWRARFPVAVVTAVNVASGVLLVVAAPHQPAFEPFVALIVAFYSLGAHTPIRRATAVLAAMFAVGIGFTIAADARGATAGNLLPPIVFLLGGWTIGRIIRSRRLRTVELEALTRELEAQRDLQAQAAVTIERGRIARELHDVVAHNVSMMVVQAGAADRVLKGDQPHVRAALATIAQTGRETVDEMRTLLGVLRPNEDGLALSPQPGLADLDELVRNVRDAGLPVELHVEGNPSALPPPLDLSAFRIVQEALTNALKHAGPARAEVTIRYQGPTVELEVRDDGAGVANGGGTGLGLIGMRERVAMFGGELEAGRGDGGFTVRARLPLDPTSA
jgi:signal transduction histidine kinase